MTRGVKAVVAISLMLLIGGAGAFMYLVTTFLFHFSGSQERMGPIVNYGALVVIVGTILLATVIWKIRSPTAAVTSTAIATPVAWVAVIFVEWLISFSLGQG